MPTSDDDAATTQAPSTPVASSVILPKRQLISTSNSPLSASVSSIPYRRAPHSSASIYASTLSPPGSRPMSPAGRGSPSSPRPAGGPPSTPVSTQCLADSDAAMTPGDPMNLILKAFVPHVAVLASQDTDDLVRGKGFDGGLWELLRPFGDRVQGKVTVRDSNGSSRSWEDFSLRFTRFGENVEVPEPPGATLKTGDKEQTSAQSRQVQRVVEAEAVVEKHLRYAEESFTQPVQPDTPATPGLDMESTSPYYALYLQRLLSGIPMSPHESFAHPVALIIATSSRDPAPIETFRKLYHDSTAGDRRLPPWVDADYLRYYVLIHDEETCDITKTIALFNQMKRHLGLHCHLLRLRSSQSAETDDDSIPLPTNDWITPLEELAMIDRLEVQDGAEDATKYIFESDATAIKTFVREMATQSIVPTMERAISVWNDQVASRRRGLTGRFMHMSKKWTGFGGGGGRGQSGTNNGSSFGIHGFYAPDTPEAIMRKLGDYAFMLRDWKLAMSTYEILRSDFVTDKAWKYHAAANEMAALSLLIMPQNTSSKARLDKMASMLEQAFYSYHTRCSAQYGAVRSITLGIELLRMRGGPAIDEAVKWGMRLMESRLIGPVADALLQERMAVCCASKAGSGSRASGNLQRKSALWSMLSAETWLSQKKYIQAQKCLNEARRSYASLQSEEGISGFQLASEHMENLSHQLKEGMGPEGLGQDDDENGSEDVEAEVEVMDDSLAAATALDRRRSRGLSMVAGVTVSREGADPLGAQDGFST